jgi:hypothetical protein
MLNRPWREADSLLSHQIEAENFDEEALLILMHIIHGHHRSVPRTLSLEQVAKIAVIIDYYQCHEAVEIYMEMWIRHLNREVPTKYCKELILWLLILYVFPNPDLFLQVTAVAVRQSRGPLQTMGLPISPGVVGEQSEKAPTWF